MPASRFGRAACLVLALCLPAAAHATPPLQVYHVSRSDPDHFGKVMPIMASEPSYGYVYTDDEDWYQVIVAGPDAAKPSDDGTIVNITYGNVPVVMKLFKKKDASHAGMSGEEIATFTQAMLTPGSAFDKLAGDTAVARLTLDLGDGDEIDGLKPPQMAAWDAPGQTNDGPGYATYGHIATPNGTVTIYCLNATSYDVCHKVITLAVRMEIGAYQ